MAPRVGRLGVWVYLAPAVSTHAPARGATIKELSIFFVVMVSTHAPARGATRPCWMGCRIAQSFNPRAREGRDPRHTRQTGRWSSVSTHAPARGATSTACAPNGRSTRFQPTRPRGARLSWGARRSGTWSFNPRAREGRDYNAGSDLINGLKFQPTRPRGARQRIEEVREAYDEFQPTRPRGARRPARPGLRRGRGVSTHAPARGATLPRARNREGQTVSTHAPARGATGTINAMIGYYMFQPTRPRGARQTPP